MNAVTPIDRRRLLPLPSTSSSRPAFIASLSREGWPWSILFVTLDVATWFACFGAAFLMRRNPLYPAFDSRLFVLIIWPLLAILFALRLIDGYDRRTDMRSLSYMTEHLIGMVFAVTMASLLIYCFVSYDFPIKPGRGTLLLGFLLFTPASLICRRTVYARVKEQTARKHFLVIGTGTTARHFAQAYQLSANHQGLRFIGSGSGASLTPPNAQTDKLDEDEVSAQLNTLTQNSEGIVVTVPLNQLSAALRDRLVRIHFQHVPVYTEDTFYETFWRRIPVFALDPAWPLQMGFQLSRNSPYRHFKRLYDLVCAAVGLLLLSPLFCVIALLILWDNGWPVIFRQERVGLGGELFTIFKFRTMRNRQQGLEGDLYTRTNDARITRVGKWLRKLRFDELPQLWNVVLDDMSLIGPRAEWTKCAEIYEGKIPSYHFRHLVKPGITGWAQVNYSYGENEEDALQKLKYDLYYIRRYSLRLDAMIVLKTLHIILLGKGQ